MRWYQRFFRRKLTEKHLDAELRFHLHFEVTNWSKLLAREGVPYLVDRYRCKSASDGLTEIRMHELTLDDSAIVLRGRPRSMKMKRMP